MFTNLPRQPELLTRILLSKVSENTFFAAEDNFYDSDLLQNIIAKEPLCDLMKVWGCREIGVHCQWKHVLLMVPHVSRALAITQEVHYTSSHLNITIILVNS